MIQFLFSTSSFFLFCSLLAASATLPNFVIIFTDDQGYGDLSCFGADHVHTPRIDQMAAEGSKLTSFYVAAPVCTPSRASLMTGSYPTRIDMGYGSRFGVLLSADSKGLHPDEITILKHSKAWATKQAYSANGISVINRLFFQPVKDSTSIPEFPTS